MPADVPVTEVVNLDAAVDALGEEPTSSEVYAAVESFSPTAAAASALRRSLAAGEGGGGGSLPDPITDPVNIDGATFEQIGPEGPTTGIFFDSGDSEGNTELTLSNAEDEGGLVLWTGGVKQFRVDNEGQFGFFGATPVAQPELPATPTEQDIADVLVALGLCTQAAP